MVSTEEVDGQSEGEEKDGSEFEEKDGSEFEGGDGSESEVGRGQVQNDEEDKDEDRADGDDDAEVDTRKRKRSVKVSPSRKATGAKTTVTPRKARRIPHPKSTSSHLPSSAFDPAELPVDPYERALRLLHVGATPESLPCREEEFVDVLSKVEEGLEGGGGGCLCKRASTE